MKAEAVAVPDPKMHSQHLFFILRTMMRDKIQRSDFTGLWTFVGDLSEFYEGAGHVAQMTGKMLAYYASRF